MNIWHQQSLLHTLLHTLEHLKNLKHALKHTFLGKVKPPLMGEVQSLLLRDTLLMHWKPAFAL